MEPCRGSDSGSNPGPGVILIKARFSLIEYIFFMCFLRIMIIYSFSSIFYRMSLYGLFISTTSVYFFLHAGLLQNSSIDSLTKRIKGKVYRGFCTPFY